MIKVDKIDVWGFEHAIRGMRNPMNSWEKSDSGKCGSLNCNNCIMSNDDFACNLLNDGDFVLGKNDLNLMQRLYKAGTEHRKYMRQIVVSMDITAPLYWWKEFDTYKIGTVANSTSTMHKIHAKEFELIDFSHEHLTEVNLSVLGIIVSALNVAREDFLKGNNKNCWWQMIQLLPSSYNQTRTITMNYENVISIIKQRTNHKLDEWNKFVDILKTLPYIEEVTQ